MFVLSRPYMGEKGFRKAMHNGKFKSIGVAVCCHRIIKNTQVVNLYIVYLNINAANSFPRNLILISKFFCAFHPRKRTTAARTHCNENPIYVFLFWELRGLSPIFYIHVSVSDYIFPWSVHIFSCRRLDRSIVGIYKSLTDTWMWKLGLWPRKIFLGNICFDFSVLFLCNAELAFSRMFSS